MKRKRKAIKNYEHPVFIRCEKGIFMHVYDVQALFVNNHDDYEYSVRVLDRDQYTFTLKRFYTEQEAHDFIEKILRSIGMKIIDPEKEIVV